MRQIKEIIIIRAEGSIDIGYVGEVFKANGWSSADRILYKLARTAPDEGYDKTDFEIIFEDGQTYKGTYDLKHISVECPSLFNHVKGFITYYAGANKPFWLDKATYDKALINVKKSDYVAFANDYLGLEL